MGKFANRKSQIANSLRVSLIVALAATAALGQKFAPGAPGLDAQWATAGKQGVGTSANLESKVWFTLAQGVMTEVYYPDVTVANVHLLQFVVVDPRSRKVETEQNDAVHAIRVLRADSPTYRQENTAKSGKWKIIKTYTADVESNSVLIDVRFETRDSALRLYFHYDPSIGNSGMKDRAYGPLLQLSGSQNFERIGSGPGGPDDSLISGNGDVSSGFVAEEGNIASVLNFTSDVEEWNNGYYGTSDGFDQLRKFGRIRDSYGEAKNGNVVQMGRIVNPERFTAVLAFAPDVFKATAAAAASLRKGFDKCLAEYEAGWAEYIRSIRKVDPRYQAQFNMAAMQLKAHEDKTVRGANIASLSVPWGGGANANENNIGGYHLIWSRDLYQVATAFMAIGDRDAAVRAVNFLFKVQQKEDGSFPQNSYLDGRPFWNSLQMDEVAYPLILAHELGMNDAETYRKHVKKAADFIVKNGPWTPQERWEEESGYSPSTIAAEIAGLVCAAEIARKNGDEGSATIYLATADEWARKIETWTVTTNGPHSKDPYYLRLTGRGRPDAGDKIELNNGAGFFDEREVVDAGFLELVRLGIKPANDRIIRNSVAVIDKVIRVRTPNGDGFYRYNNDGYGEMDDGRRWNWDGKYTGKGRLWALLSGERGQYELAIHQAGRNANADRPLTRGNAEWELMRLSAEGRLATMMRFANDGLMIPEQVWDKPAVPARIDRQFVPDLKFGEGTGSATPLAWSMAQFIRLVVNLSEGRNLDTPKVVYDRYAAKRIPGKASYFGSRADEELVLPVNAGSRFVYPREFPAGTRFGYLYRGETRFATAGADGKVTLEIVAPEKDEVFVGGVILPDGTTAMERLRLRSADGVVPQKIPADVVERIGNAARSPIVEKNRLIFFHRGAASGVTLAGDLTGWAPRLPLTKVAEGLFARVVEMDPGARTEYKIVVDGKWMLDPLNPDKISNGIDSENSIAAMPGYAASKWATPTGGLPDLKELEVQSKTYGKRKIRIYLPPGYERSTARFPVMYVQDGSQYFDAARATVQQENLVREGRLKPFIMVFLDPGDRMKEYWASDEYARFLAEEVVPAVDSAFRTVRDRSGRAVWGASLGGVTAVHAGLRYPSVFMRVGGQSSSFWLDNDRVISALAASDLPPMKFYLDDGTLEGAEDSRRAALVIASAGHSVRFVETEAGHNWTAWRDRLAEGFVALMD